MIDKDALMDYITPTHIETIMKSLGSDLHKQKENEMWFTTICHCGDSSKLCYYIKSKLFYCYTECGAFNLFQLVMNIRECAFKEALEYIASTIGYSNYNSFSSKKKSDKTLALYKRMRSKKSSQQYSENKIFNSNILNYFDAEYFYSGWIKESISEEAMLKYNIKWYDPQKYIIIPHYDVDNNLIGIRRRSLNNDDIYNKCKYMPLCIDGEQYSHSLGSNLYGINIAKEAIQQSKKAVIVEGEKSVLQGYSYYQNKSNIVATCGFNITKNQIQTLLSLGTEEIILGFDKDFYSEDAEYEMYIKRILSLTEKIIPFCNVSFILDENNLLDLKDSPTDKGKEIYEILFNNRVYC